MTLHRVLGAAALVFSASALSTQARAADQLRFWNLTSSTLVDVALAPAGTVQFGPNQCANDRDGAVDHDERLKLTGINPGRYDVRITTKKGQRCLARNVAVKGDGRYAFSLSDEDLSDCHAAATP